MARFDGDGFVIFGHLSKSFVFNRKLAFPCNPAITISKNIPCSGDVLIAAPLGGAYPDASECTVFIGRISRYHPPPAPSPARCPSLKTLAYHLCPALSRIKFRVAVGRKTPPCLAPIPPCHSERSEESFSVPAPGSHCEVSPFLQCDKYKRSFEEFAPSGN